jgi:hypothetical protein
MSTQKPFSFEPMLCESAERLPEGREWRYELKLDGFRDWPQIRPQLPSAPAASIAPVRVPPIG